MASPLPIPPTGTPVFDPKTGEVTETWRRYFLSLENLGPIIPPIDATYWLSRSDPSLTNERNIGALASGYLKIVTAASTATPSTVPTIPAGDVTGENLTRTNDTNVTLTLTGTPVGSLLKAVNVAVGWLSQLGLSRGGTHADLSGTGGTSQVLKQSSVGADVTVGPLAYTDITGLAANIYTPTLTHVANLTASTPYSCQYLRVGGVVTVSGRVDVDPTTVTTLTQLGISLPIASNFTSTNECAGAGACGSLSGYSVAIQSDPTNDRAEMTWTPSDVANNAVFFTFTYRVIP